MCFRPAAIDAPVICANCGKAISPEQAKVLDACPYCGYSDMGGGAEDGIPHPPGSTPAAPPAAPRASAVPAAPRASAVPSAPKPGEPAK